MRKRLIVLWVVHGDESKLEVVEDIEKVDLDIGQTMDGFTLSFARFYQVSPLVITLMNVLYWCPLKKIRNWMNEIVDAV
jgi:hypothetical protein